MPVGIAVAAVGLGISIYQGAKASKQKKEAKEAMENYDRQDLKNPYMGLDRYPAEAIALQKDANARELATNVSVASMSGRGLSIMPQASATYNRRSRELYGEIEKYTLERDKLIAKGESEKQGMQERREEQDIAGLGNLYATADQNLNNAIVSGANSLAIGAESAMGNAKDGGFSLGGDGSKKAARQTARSERSDYYSNKRSDKVDSGNLYDVYEDEYDAPWNQ